MAVLSLMQLKPGMVVAKDVVSFSGEVLFYQGNAIQNQDIKNFKAWGITEVEIEGSITEKSDSPLDDFDIDAEILKKAQMETAELFRFSNRDHPFIKELMRLNTLHQLKKEPGLEDMNVY